MEHNVRTNVRLYSRPLKTSVGRDPARGCRKQVLDLCRACPTATRLVQGPGKVLHEENSRTALTIIAGSKEARKVPQFLAAFTGTSGTQISLIFLPISSRFPISSSFFAALVAFNYNFLS